MWLMTRHGFFSIVCARGPGGYPDPELMMIRARKRAHLKRLRHYHKDLGKIKHTTTTDYPYRLIASKDVVMLVVARLVAELAYGNFKAEAKVNLPKDKRYHRFLTSVWGLGLWLGPRRKPTRRASFNAGESQ